MPQPTCRKLETRDVRMDIVVDAGIRWAADGYRTSVSPWLLLHCPHCLFTLPGGSSPFWKPQLDLWLADFVQRHNQEPRV